MLFIWQRLVMTDFIITKFVIVKIQRQIKSGHLGRLLLFTYWSLIRAAITTTFAIGHCIHPGEHIALYFSHFRAAHTGQHKLDLAG